MTRAGGSALSLFGISSSSYLVFTLPSISTSNASSVDGSLSSGSNSSGGGSGESGGLVVYRFDPATEVWGPSSEVNLNSEREMERLEEREREKS